jgi:penicillin-binding protein 1A
MQIKLSVLPPVKKKRRKSLTLRFLGFAFTAGVFLFVGTACVAAYFLWKISQELPDYDSLARYKPAVVTRVHAGDGRMIAEFARERRIYVPIDSIPKKVINGFLAAEDKNFYQHPGLDWEGIARAVYTYAVNMGQGRTQGASTITQQVAKNFLLSNERSLTRKVKEAILSIRMERAYTKDRILELYLNEIYLGMGAYGVAAAGLTYFAKELHELDVEEIAYLAALPKAPSRYHPVKDRERALARRNWVIERMVADGHVAPAEGEAARKRPLAISGRQISPNTFAADYFAEQVRRSLLDLYGENGPDSLYAGGYSVRSTLDTGLQHIARSVLREGLVNFDRRRGWRGPITKIDTASGEWGARLAEVAAFSDIDPWRLGIVLQTARDKALIGLQPGRDVNGNVEAGRKTMELGLESVKWAFDNLATRQRPKNTMGVSDVLAVGDVVYVAPPSDIEVMEREMARAQGKPEKAPLQWRLMQVPEIEGAIVVMDPHTGRILALVGGFSFAESQFDRAVQAKRQPGSSYKPFVYAAALDNGYNPSSIVNDSVLAVDQGQGLDIWKPSNYDGKIHGPSTLRVGIEKSRNLMTVRLAQDLGMPIISEYSKRFGIYDDLPPLLSMALGAGETTLLRLTTAYSMFANGGKQVRPTFIDRIQDRFGQTVWRHDARICQDCSAEKWLGQDEPEIEDDRRQIVDAHTAYQITSMLEGVVQRGTGTKILAVGKPLAGKTGTTNDEKDAWFVGFSPDLAVGVFIGHDTPQPMGKGETGGELAAPVFRDFFKLALNGKPAVPFRLPQGIRLIRVNKRTGTRAEPGDPETIVEAFKPGTEPPEGYAYAGYADGGNAGEPSAAWGQSQGGGGGWGASTAQQPSQDGGYGGYGSSSRGPSYGGARSPQAGGLY